MVPICNVLQGRAILNKNGCGFTLCNLYNGIKLSACYVCFRCLPTHACPHGPASCNTRLWRRGTLLLHLLIETLNVSVRRLQCNASHYIRTLLYADSSES